MPLKESDWLTGCRPRGHGDRRPTLYKVIPQNQKSNITWWGSTCPLLISEHWSAWWSLFFPPPEREEGVGSCPRGRFEGVGGWSKYDRWYYKKTLRLWRAWNRAGLAIALCGGFSSSGAPYLRYVYLSDGLWLHHRAGCIKGSQREEASPTVRGPVI